MDEVIRKFSKHGIRYLVIGGQAVRLHGYPRFSMDWDLFIPPRDINNLEAINRAIGDILDVPLGALGAEGQNFIQTYQTPWGILQFHLAGPGLPDFDDAERRSVVFTTESGTEVACLCGEDLLASKRAAGRPQDLADIRFLELKAENGKL